MNRKSASGLSLILLLASICFSQTEPKKTADKISTSSATTEIVGWQAPSANDRKSYAISLDRSVKHHGDAGLSIRSIVPHPANPNNTFVRQEINAAGYLNKRMRFTVFAKIEDVESANFWMQVNRDDMVVVNDDHMSSRPLKGTADWRRYDIVLDVPASSSLIVLGISLKGSGQVWVDDLSLEEVGLEVPVTTVKSSSEIEAGSMSFIQQYKSANPEAYELGLKVAKEKPNTLPKKPRNLDFEERELRP